MKAYRFIIIAAAALTVCACAKESRESAGTKQNFTITASYAENKTTLLDAGAEVYWEPAEDISIFFEDANIKFTSLNKNNARSAVFTTAGTLIIATTEGEDKLSLNGLYPYNENAQCDETGITTTLPAIQDSREGTFARNLYPSMGQSSTTQMSFYNVCGGLRFTLVNSGITGITFEALGGENIAGKYTASFTNGLPAVSKVEEGSNIITLNAPEGGVFQTGKWYYIVALPATLANGFKMSFEKDEKIGTKSTDKSVTISRGSFGNLENIDEGVEFKSQGAKSDWIAEGGTNPQNLIDGVYETYWKSSSATLPASVVIDMQVAKTFNKINLSIGGSECVGPSPVSTAAKKIKVDVSNDKDSWTTVLGETTLSLNSYAQSFNFNSTATGRYFRITVTAGVAAGKPVVLSEVDFANGDSYSTGDGGYPFAQFNNRIAPFNYVIDDPLGWNRFGYLVDWTLENASVCYDSNANQIIMNAIPTAAGGIPNTDNGKIFQTLYLMPGLYYPQIYTGSYGHEQIGDEPAYYYMDAYLVYTKGETLTDYDKLTKSNTGTLDPNFLAKQSLNAKAPNTWVGAYVNIFEPTYVSIGLVFKTEAEQGHWVQQYVQKFYMVQNDLK